jgi:excisionase family DNA binding protein
MPTSRQPRPRRRTLTPADVADIFGVSVATVREWANDGRLPSFRTPGGQRRFRQEDIDAYLEAGDGDAAAGA